MDYNCEWHVEAERLRFDEGLSWRDVARGVEHLLPDMDEETRMEKVRRVLRRSKRYGETEKQDFQRGSLEYKTDGQIISEKFITVRDGIDMTPEFILTAHGLDVEKWEVVSYKNNFWNSQVKGGGKQISYQSKLTAKPRTAIVTFSDIAEQFKQLDREQFTPPHYAPVQGSMMAEVNIADLHLGKLCWHGDTPENYDSKIAKELFYKLVSEIAFELKQKPIERILFVWANDFFNSDNEQKTTTAGTPQDTDVRNKKMFNTGCEMLVRAIEMFAEIAPVETFYTPSNHDEETAYHAIGFVSAWFRQDPRVAVNMDAYPRKYELYGNTLIGFTHGDKENDKGNKDKASRLASLMPLEAKNLWWQARFYEMHTAHLHSEQMIQEINGVIVRRISSPTALDLWHTTSGYIGSVRKAQTFIYDKERGLVQIINTPV